MSLEKFSMHLSKQLSQTHLNLTFIPDEALSTVACVLIDPVHTGAVIQTGLSSTLINVFFTSNNREQNSTVQQNDIHNYNSVL